ncbi:MAG: Asp-tRNA(Asn)/Glu-tRNA(Gln) amidotransferase subunit GatB [bacterium]|nr:Asp-tRNA(Asn)/Glu-tRNA(Gln) amidotransferase subunit GatB [bacterium]
MELEAIIGLETHIQLKTATKMFCGCDNQSSNAPPNTTICPVCTGHPGTLPVINRAAVEHATRMSLALHLRILEHVKFDRKNYFYPDLPKGYQISMYDLPIGVDGYLDIPSADGTTRIRIHRLHLEDDAAKLLHSPDEQWSYVDYNRAGTPLMEIVTEPDFRSPADAKRYLQELRTIARYTGASDADMENGQLRCDVNISLRPIGETKLWTKTEVKNVNSFKAVERTLEYEIRRQTKLWQTNTPPTVSTTRGWNDAKQATIEQRWKEGEGDYRYFPEPDLPPVHSGPLQPIDPEQIRASLPELPQERRKRFVEELGIATTDVDMLTADPALSNFTEQVVSELQQALQEQALDEAPAQGGSASGGKAGRTVGGWIASKLTGILNDRGIAFADAKITAENFAELLTLFLSHRVNSTTAVRILEQMAVTGADPHHLLEEMHVEQVSDGDALTSAIDAAIAANPGPVADYRAGKTNAVQFLVGQVMKTMKGTANPGVVRKLLEEQLQP